MDWKERLEKHLFGNWIVSLLVSENEKSSWFFHATVLEKSEAGQLRVIHELDFDSPGLLNAWLESEDITNIPLVMCIDTPEILCRKIEGSTNEKEDLLRKVIPQAKQDDFFVEYNSVNNDHFVALVRRHVIDNIHQLLSDKAMAVSISLAPTVVAGMSIGVPEEELKFGIWSVSKVDGQLDSISRVEEGTDPELSINEAGISIKNILNFASALCYWTKFDVKTDFDTTYYRQELLHKLLIRKYAKYVLAALFVIFFINTIFFFSLSSRNKELQEQNAGIQSVNQKISAYREFVNSNKNLLEGGNSFLTRIVDDIGSSVPDGINLQTLELRPLYLSSKKAEDTNKVIVSGQCEESRDYTQWVEELSMMQWADGIASNEYNLNVNTGQGSFTVEITLITDVQ